MKSMPIGTVSLLGIAAVVLIAILASQQGLAGDAPQGDKAQKTPNYSKSGYDIRRLPPKHVEDLAERLTPEQRHVLLEEGTEVSGTGTLVHNEKEGTYACRLCGLPLYSSKAKFDSGTGWPSFYAPIDPDHVHLVKDDKLGVTRVEVECRRCRSHLGHVFNDGPKPTGKRYCMNSAALKFYEKGSDMPSESKPVEKKVAFFAGGCFWGVEDRFQHIDGVIDAVSGYQGGVTKDPTYREVCSGKTGHAETVKVVFDPNVVSYDQLLEAFFKMHNPTQLNRQGVDVGAQYRSAIFTTTSKQAKEARAYVEALQKSDRFRGKKIVTQIVKAPAFYKAEDYHQDYDAKHGRSCALPSGS